MNTCKACGWEIRQDGYGLWLDQWRHPICGWDKDEAYEHQPIAVGQTANNSGKLVA